MLFNKKFCCLFICCLPLLTVATTRHANKCLTHADTVPNQNWQIKAIITKRDIPYLKLTVNGKVVRSINVRTLAELEGVWDIEPTLISARKVNGKYYVLFTYQYPSTTARGNGYCGAGYEDVLAMLCLNAKFKITHFERYLTDSCVENVKKLYGYNEAHPEYGIWVRKGEHL